ncbi:guanosine-5'-triphosphate,3'-diphosphate pyrophosphatase [Gallaecimonas kandeliae]|uniref:Ppx/GppA phosphatase family protein n=1 Tax=Gallaecimonas kandeliae TaxID=3029055 RepID=UPI002647D632|nr:guanosine-5'-triphosphate,3'-diphosphate pyrophosphatase [Gallaecimonas kandeliae]WKE65553.1 guanosine-5'-triphosphate,3'-diphosphate pyrophosphatase [Gallaecimonas kandeliae]
MGAVSPLYAAIDLGSNSFHMLVARSCHGQVQTLAKVKRKVRLAAGLDDSYQLSLEAMERGWQCLTLFAERLQGIPSEQVRVVATATLRYARNADTFLREGERILGCPIQVISGEEEAALIYQGVAHTSGQEGRRLVVDIGGASTELVIGTDFAPEKLQSLEMGCVTFQNRYFADGNLSQQAFDAAIAAAQSKLTPLRDHYLALGWDHCVGASGSVQAVQEVQLARGENETLTLARLRQTLATTVACGHMDSLAMPGLMEERKPVFAAGLAILIAIFESLAVSAMEASGGALREGVIYGLLPAPELDVRSRTLAAISARFSLDESQGERVAELVSALAPLSLDPEQVALAAAAARLHELGLAVGFKQAADHGAYLLNHLDLPGFNQHERRDLVALLAHQEGSLDGLPRRLLLPAALLRLAILLCASRQDPPEGIQLHSQDNELVLALPVPWLAQRPLLSSMLEEEQGLFHTSGISLRLI